MDDRRGDLPARGGPPAATTTVLPTPATRERVIALLCDAFAQGLFEMEEFERRVTLAQTSPSAQEVEALTSDLPAELGPSASSAPRPITLQGAQVKATDQVAAIMGGVERRGSWTVPRRLQVVALMGGVVLDLREARFPPGPVEIRVSTLMGGVHILVPPHLALESSGTAIMGAFEYVDRVPQNPGPDAPLVRVSGLTIMGGVEIEMRLPGETEKEARKRRRKEQRQRARQKRLY